MLRILLLISLLVALQGCGPAPTHLEEIMQRGELLVATRNTPTTYYEGPHGDTGFEYELAQLFAQSLGVELKLVIPETFPEILQKVEQREVDLAAAGLTITEQRKQRLRFSSSYQSITPQLVYRSGNRKPKNLDQLSGHLEVVAGTSHEERLIELREKHSDLQWTTTSDLDPEELLALVWEQVLDYTVADSHELAVNQRFYPELRVAFDIGPAETLGWAMPNGDDKSLSKAVERFLKSVRKDGTLEQLLERHYGHVGDFDYVGTRRYLSHINTRLPPLRALFETAGDETGLDWRLLAAIGYQESHWRADAVSPTGVRGVMMLTLNTMRELGLDDRRDPAQSILGGARYVVRMRDKIADRIQEPDRTWLALAAYNVGYGHLEDARVLAQQNGGDPDKWVDVKEYLPLLSKKKWYKKTKHGYARGREPVIYVENIRSYYDILNWQMAQRQEPETPAPELPGSSPLL